MSIKRNVRLRRIKASSVLETMGKLLKPKMIRWLKGRIAWDMGRKRTGK